MKLLVRLTFGFAWSRDRMQRWRQLSIVVAAGIAALLALLSVGLVGFAHDAEERRLARMPVLATHGQPYGLSMSLRAEIWQNRQFPVVWLAEGQPGAPVLLPPGLARLPDPGTAVVSPGLIESGATEGLGLVASNAGTGPNGTIGPEGLGAPSEWLAYARPSAGRSLGEGVLLHVSGFGPGPSDPMLSIETQDPTPSVRSAWFAAAWLFLLPAAILAAGAAAALSPTRTRRLQLLHRLGLSTKWLRVLSAAETAALAVAGVAAAAALWLLAAPGITRLPLTGLTLPPGGLGISAGLVALTAVAVLVAFAGLGLLGARLDDTSATRPSSRRVEVPVSAWRLTPMVLAALMLLASRLVDRNLGALLIWSSLLVLLGGLPWALPWLVRVLGQRLAVGGNPARWLAGQRLSFAPSALARPAVAIGALVFVAGALTGLALRYSATPELGGQPVGLYVLSWHDARPGDEQRVSELLTPASVFPLRDSDGTTTQAFLPDCQAAVAVVGDTAGQTCTAAGLTDTATAAWNARTQTVPVLGPAPSLGAGEIGTVLVAGDPGPSAAAVWHATNSELPAVNLTRLGPETMAPPQVRDWLLAAGAVGLGVLLLGFLQSYGNRVLAVVAEDRRLVRVALDAREVTAVQRWTLAGPLLLAAPAGFVCATVFVVAANDLELAIPATGWLLLEVTIIGVASAWFAVGLGNLQRSWLS